MMHKQSEQIAKHKIAIVRYKEYIQFLCIALGSASEVETQIIIGKRIGYFKDIDNYIENINEIKKMLNRLISSLKRNI